MLRGPGGRAGAHRQHPARRADRQRGRRRGAAPSAGSRPALAAGHSLGEYSALVVAGALALRATPSALVRRRGEFMQEAVPVGTGAMAASWASSWPPSSSCAPRPRRARWSSVANINSPGQIVIAGHRTRGRARGEAVAGARRPQERAAAGERALPLRADDAGRRAPRRGARAGARCAIPRVPVVRNVDAGRHRGRPTEVRPFLLRQVASPVRWTDCVQRLAARAPTVFVEVGPGRVLTGLLKRIARRRARPGGGGSRRRSTRPLARAGGGRVSEASRSTGGRDRHRRQPRHRRGDRRVAGRARSRRGSLWPRRGPAASAP